MIELRQSTSSLQAEMKGQASVSKNNFLILSSLVEFDIQEPIDFCSRTTFTISNKNNIRIKQIKTF